MLRTEKGDTSVPPFHKSSRAFRPLLSVAISPLLVKQCLSYHTFSIFALAPSELSLAWACLAVLSELAALRSATTTSLVTALRFIGLLQFALQKRENHIKLFHSKHKAQRHINRNAKSYRNNQIPDGTLNLIRNKLDSKNHK